MENYIILREIGRGAHGRAFKAISSRTNCQVVVKKINLLGLSGRNMLDTMNEINVLKSLNHPNIVRHMDNFRENDSIYIVMEFAGAGDLASRIKSVKASRSSFTEHQVSSWIFQLLSGLSFLHSKYIIHRDMKPQNIFVTSTGERVMIGDFGVCKVLESKTDFAKTMTGTPYYLSPEIFQGRPYTTKSDIWSFGCVLFELVALKVPFDASDFRSLGLIITRGSNPTFPPQYSKDLRDIFLETMRRNAGNRPDAEELLSRSYFAAQKVTKTTSRPVLPRSRLPPLSRASPAPKTSRSLSPYRAMVPSRVAALPSQHQVKPSSRPRSVSPYTRRPSPRPTAACIIRKPLSPMRMING